MDSLRCDLAECRLDHSRLGKSPRGDNGPGLRVSRGSSGEGDRGLFAMICELTVSTVQKDAASDVDLGVKKTYTAPWVVVDMAGLWLSNGRLEVLLA
jgi:hypothetical protein